MSIARICAWCIVILLAYIPINWILLGISGEIPSTTDRLMLALSGLGLWAAAGGLAYFLIMSAKGLRLQAAREARQLQEIADGPLTEVIPTRTILKAGEKAYACAAADLIENRTIGYEGRSAGVSVRVAKGVTVRTGGVRGEAVKDWVTVSSGELVLTDTRIAFAGDRKPFVIPLDELLGVVPYSDGFSFSDAKMTRVVVLNGERSRKVFWTVLQKVLKERQTLPQSA